MTDLFSKRCKKLLKKKELIVSIPVPVRRRILKILYDFDEPSIHRGKTGYQYDSSTVEDIPGLFEGEHGVDMKVYHSNGSGEIVKGEFEDFILRGAYPPYLLDIIELFYQSLSDEEKYIFQSSINEIMKESDLIWRMLEGGFFPIDSVYINEVIIKKTFELIKDIKFFGALKEFKKARTSLLNNDYESAIHNSNLAVESVIKEILNVKKAKPGKLFKMLIDSDLVPEYYAGFLKAFEENILRSVAIMRNEEVGVGHGKGPSDNIIPYELAELSINLSGVIINFLINRVLANKEDNSNDNKKEPDFLDEDIPF